jgi:DNA-binding MarR family transcriptional regulator
MPRNPSPPLRVAHEVRDACLCLHLQRAARIVARRYDDAFRGLRLSSGQFSLLMALHRDAPAHVAAVAALLGADRTTITANLKPLIRSRLVAVAHDASDRRRRQLRLTPAGRRMLADAIPIWRRIQIELGRRVASPGRLNAALRALGAADADRQWIDR